MPFYKTDDTKFYNPLAMFAYASEKTPHTYPTFDFYDHEFSQHEWSNEPIESFQTLMERRAVNLREKYDKLVFFFSGGTDSITMFNVFKKLNIHIDEIVTTYHKDLTLGYSPTACDWIKKNHYDPTTTLSFVERIGTPEYLKSASSGFALDPRWVYTSVNAIINSNSSRIAEWDRKYREAGINAGILTGLEKPHLLLKDGKWYASHLDKVLMVNEGWFPEQNIEHFYITPDMPELHIKQCHMLKNNVQKFLRLAKDWSSAEWAGRNWKNFQFFSFWSGRDENIILENALYQKTSTNNVQFNTAYLLTKSIESAELGGLPSEQLIQGGENREINKFLEEMLSLQSDHKLIEYMKRCCLLHPSGAIDKYHGIYSKQYYLGDN